MILTKTQDALHGLSDLLREASNLLGSKTDPAELAKAFAKNTQAIDDFIANSEYAGVNLLDGDEIKIIVEGGTLVRKDADDTPVKPGPVRKSRTGLPGTGRPKKPGGEPA